MPATEDLCADVRAHCASVAASARHVRIDVAAAPYTSGVVGLDPDVHLLDADVEERARYVLVMDAINFGSGWFDELGDGSDAEVTNMMSRRLTEHARSRGGTWTGSELRSLAAADVAGVLGVDPGHELMSLYARALRDLGAWLGSRSASEAVGAAGGSASRLARSLAEGMPFFDDPGFYKRAQITANDLALAGVADFADLDSLTVFADNLLPHVLRTDGVLVYDDALAGRVDAGSSLEPGSREETELRACAVHACELIARELGVAPRVLDNWLWNLGREERYLGRPPHRTRTTAY